MVESSDPAQKILASGYHESLPTYLSSLSLFEGGQPDRPSRALLKFGVRVAMWADGAKKARYLFIPPGARARLDREQRRYDFPVGTVFVKHFETPTDPPQPIETRVMMLDRRREWNFATYRWSGNDAIRSIRPNRTTRADVEYRIPSTNECKLCHMPDKPILGFEPEQLVWEPDELESWGTRLELENGEDPQKTLTSRSALEDPADPSIPTARRARAYMQVNCSHCHRPGGSLESVGLDLRLDAIETGLLRHKKLIPQDLAGSILWQKISGLEDRMQPLSVRPDPVAVDIFRKLIEEWPILSGP